LALSFSIGYNPFLFKVFAVAVALENPKFKASNNAVIKIHDRR
jgi:hypothetical protein